MTQHNHLSAILVLVGISAMLAPGSSDASRTTGTEWYPSEVAAVVAAANRYNPISIREDREFMGLVLRDAECYSFTATPGFRG